MVKRTSHFEHGVPWIIKPLGGRGFCPEGRVFRWREIFVGADALAKYPQLKRAKVACDKTAVQACVMVRAGSVIGR